MILRPLVKTAQENVISGRQRSIAESIRRLQAWHYLILVCAVFWLLFAVISIISGYLFLVAALATIALLSALVILLAWAYQNNI